MKNRYEIHNDHAEVFVEHKSTIVSVLLDIDVLLKFINDKKSITARKCGNKTYITYSVDGKNQYIHRLITNCPDGKVVDHINRNTLDNRRVNLRVVSKSANMFNQEETKGIDFRKDSGKWRARIFVDGKENLLGYFSTRAEAYEARVRAETEYFPKLLEVSVYVS